MAFVINTSVSYLDNFHISVLVGLTDIDSFTIENRFTI